MEQEIRLYIDQGTNFSFPMVVTDDNGIPINLGTALVKSQMRAGWKSATAYDFVCTGDSNGNVELAMPFALTSTIKGGRYVFDAFYIIDNVPTKFLTGMVIVMPSSTVIPAVTLPQV